MIQQAAYVAASVVFGIGLYGVLTSRDMVRICVSLSVLESAVVLVLVAAAYRAGGAAPILDGEAAAFVDPLPHALSLTAIVIGAGIISVALALTVVVHRRYGTTDLRTVLRRQR